MADTLVHVKGLSDLQAFLDQLAPKVERNILRGALRAGMKPIQEDAKQHAAVASGLLRDGLKISTRAKGGTVTASLKSTGKHGFLAHWIEFGTAAHTITTKGLKSLSVGGLFFQSVNHPGIAPYGDKSIIGPHAFMRPALDARAQDAVVAAGNYIKKRLSTKEGLDTSDVMIEGDQ